MPATEIAVAERRLASLPGVTSVHDLHIWTATDGIESASGSPPAAASTVSHVLAGPFVLAAGLNLCGVSMYAMNVTILVLAIELLPGVGSVNSLFPMQIGNLWGFLAGLPSVTSPATVSEGRSPVQANGVSPVRTVGHGGVPEATRLALHDPDDQGRTQRGGAFGQQDEVRRTGDAGKDGDLPGGHG